MPDAPKPLSPEEVAWRSSEDWERQAKLYEQERDELQRDLDQQRRLATVLALEVADVRTQLAEARKALVEVQKASDGNFTITMKRINRIAREAIDAAREKEPHA